MGSSIGLRNLIFPEFLKPFFYARSSLSCFVTTQNKCTLHSQNTRLFARDEAQELRADLEEGEVAHQLVLLLAAAELAQDGLRWARTSTNRVFQKYGVSYSHQFKLGCFKNRAFHMSVIQG